MLKLFLAQLGIEALVKCIEGCLSWAFFATPSGQAILTKLLESKDFTVTLAVQLLCGPFGSNAHKPAGVQMFNSVYLETRTIVARQSLPGIFLPTRVHPVVPPPAQGCLPLNPVWVHLLRGVCSG